MEKIRIFFVIDYLGGGGAERQFLNLINNMDTHKFQPYVFIAERKGERFYELKPEVKVYGLIGSGKRQTLKALWLLRKVVYEISPHIIQTWLDYSAFITAISLRNTRRNFFLVASHRASIEELYNNEVRCGRLKKRLLIWAYKKYDIVTTNSIFLSNQLEAYGLRKIKVIYNGIDVGPLLGLAPKEQLCNKLGLSFGKFNIIFVGVLVKGKGIEYLVKAIKDIKNDKIRLIILGDGRLRESVCLLIGNDKRFKLLGYKSNAVEYIKASDLLVLPSMREGLPNVILEAMAVGTPVVATNIYGIPELIENNVNGLLVQPRNVDELKGAVENIIVNPEMARRFASVSLEKVKLFNIERMVNSYKELYLELLKTTAP